MPDSIWTDSPPEREGEEKLTEPHELVLQMNAWLDGASPWSMPERERWDREAMQQLARLAEANGYLEAEIADLRKLPTPETLAALEKCAEALRVAQRMLLNANDGAWENGVTGPGGFPDEGEVMASRCIDSVDAALSALDAARKGGVDD